MLAEGHDNKADMGRGAELSFQHWQRLATAQSMELLCVSLENDSRVTLSCQIYQANHAFVIEKRCFIHVDVGASQGFPELRTEARFVQKPRDGIRIPECLRHFRSGRV